MKKAGLLLLFLLFIFQVQGLNIVEYFDNTNINFTQSSGNFTSDITWFVGNYPNNNGRVMTYNSDGVRLDSEVNNIQTSQVSIYTYLDDISFTEETELIIDCSSIVSSMSGFALFFTNTTPFPISSNCVGYIGLLGDGASAVWSSCSVKDNAIDYGVVRNCLNTRGQIHINYTNLISSGFSENDIKNIKYVGFTANTYHSGGSNLDAFIYGLNISNLFSTDNLLPYFNITYNKTQVCLLNNSAEFHYSIEAYDPDGDDILYSVNKPYQEVIKGEGIDFDTNAFTFGMQKAVGQWIGCELIPSFMQNVLQDKDYDCDPKIKYDLEFDKEDYYRISTNCNSTYNVMDPYRWGIRPKFISASQGFALEFNTAQCTDSTYIYNEPYSKNFALSTKIGLGNFSSVYWFMTGSNFDSVPILLQRNESNISVSYNGVIDYGSYDADSLVLLAYNYFNSSSYVLEIRNGDVKEIEILNTISDVPLTNPSIEGIGIVSLSGKPWVDDIYFMTLGQYMDWSNSYSSPFVFDKVGTYTIRVSVTDEFHQEEFFNYKDVTVTVVPQQLCVEDIFEQDVTTDTKKFGDFFFGSINGGIIKKKLLDNIIWVYMMFLVVAYFSTRNLDFSFITTNIIFIVLALFGLSTVEFLLLLIVLTALSLTPFLASKFSGLGGGQ